jgi:hypothetical protein
MGIWTIGELEDGLSARGPDGAPGRPKIMLGRFNGQHVARFLNRATVCTAFP